jgi:hypothetical protein
MNKWSDRNLILHFFFLIVAFICFIKRESDVINCADSCHFYIQTYTSLLVTSQEIPDRIVQYYFSGSRWKHLSHISKHLQQGIAGLTFKYALQNYEDLFYNTAQLFSPAMDILNILHCHNIWHQSSDDAADLSIV